ncbi:hypothetical protein YPPY95_4721, partial [Yersinia pestis PY-95]
MILLALAQRL